MDLKIGMKLKHKTAGNLCEVISISDDPLTPMIGLQFEKVKDIIYLAKTTVEGFYVERGPESIIYEDPQGSAKWAK